MINNKFRTKDELPSTSSENNNNARIYEWLCEKKLISKSSKSSQDVCQNDINCKKALRILNNYENKLLKNSKHETANPRLSDFVNYKNQLPVKAASDNKDFKSVKRTTNLKNWIKSRFSFWTNKSPKETEVNISSMAMQDSGFETKSTDSTSSSTSFNPTSSDLPLIQETSSKGASQVKNATDCSKLEMEKNVAKTDSLHCVPPMTTSAKGIGNVVCVSSNKQELKTNATDDVLENKPSTSSAVTSEVAQSNEPGDNDETYVNETESCLVDNSRCVLGDFNMEQQLIATSNNDENAHLMKLYLLCARKDLSPYENLAAQQINYRNKTLANGVPYSAYQAANNFIDEHGSMVHDSENIIGGGNIDQDNEGLGNVHDQAATDNNENPEDNHPEHEPQPQQQPEPGHNGNQYHGAYLHRPVFIGGTFNFNM